MGPGDVGSLQGKSVCRKAQESLGAICCESQIMNSAHRETKGAKGNFVFNRWSPLLHSLKGWNTPEEPKSKPFKLNPKESTVHHLLGAADPHLMSMTVAKPFLHSRRGR
jgi:hypothetical protein